MNGLRARWLVLLLGGILLATTVLFGVPDNAEAQGQAKGKAQEGQGQVQGQAKGKAQGEDEAEGGGGQEKVTLCHKGKNIITVGAPAVDAHRAHGDTVIEPGVAIDECGTSGLEPSPEDPEPCLPEVFGTVEVQKGPGNTSDTIEQGDEILIPVTGDFELAETGPLSITLQNPSGDPVEFVDGDNAEITKEPEGTLRIVVGEDASDLSIPDPNDPNADPIDIVDSEGILCPDSEEPLEPVTLTGTLATTRSGDVALRTKDGKGDPKVLPLVAQTEGQEERLKQLAERKLRKVKVTGSKVNDREAKGTKAKEDRKNALKVTSVKKAEVQKTKKQ